MGKGDGKEWEGIYRYRYLKIKRGIHLKASSG
jgi:hypothetical protein